MKSRYNVYSLDINKEMSTFELLKIAILNLEEFQIA